MVQIRSVVSPEEISDFNRENINVRQLPPLLVLIGAKEISDFNRENINVRQLPPLLVLIGAKEISGFTEKTLMSGNFLHYWY